MPKIASRCYFYYARAHELKGSYSMIRGYAPRRPAAPVTSVAACHLLSMLPLRHSEWFGVVGGGRGGERETALMILPESSC